MKIQEFEKAVLRLAFETDTRITTASIAYYLKIPSREANELLNLLLEEGVLEFDSDSSGNLFYKVANHDGGSLPAFDNLQANLNLPAPIIQAHLTTIEGSENTPALTIQPRPLPTPQRSTELVVQSKVNLTTPALIVSTKIEPPVPKTKFENLRRSPIKKTISAEPDGTLGSLSAFVISEETRCDPQPIASRNVSLATCDDVPSHIPIAVPNQQWYDSKAMVSYEDTRALIDIEEPEHQPGMALLLSLILPGTGQIYNNEVTKGVTMMVLCFLLWFVLLGWVVQIWSIVDAVVVAEKINRKPGRGNSSGEPQPQT